MCKSCWRIFNGDGFWDGSLPERANALFLHQKHERGLSIGRVHAGRASGLPLEAELFASVIFSRECLVRSLR